jgi:hypothetical protein
MALLFTHMSTDAEGGLEGAVVTPGTRQRLIDYEDRVEAGPKTCVVSPC